MNSFMGMRVVTSSIMTVPAEDWSRVRSPSRARRRMRYGHRQNVRYYDAPSPKAAVIGGVLYCHPEMVIELKRAAYESGVPSFGSVF